MEIKKAVYNLRIVKATIGESRTGKIMFTFDCEFDNQPDSKLDNELAGKKAGRLWAVIAEANAPYSLNPLHDALDLPLDLNDRDPSIYEGLKFSAIVRSKEEPELDEDGEPMFVNGEPIMRSNIDISRVLGKPQE